MFKKLVLIGIISLLSVVYGKNIVVFADVSKGIDIKEAKELVTLIDPRISPSIYEDGDKVYGYILNETKRSIVRKLYVSKSTSRKGYQEFVKKFYFVYFKALKKYAQNTRKIRKNKIGQDIVFLVDTSGSMQKNKIVNNVKSALKNIVRYKGKKVNIAIVTYDGHSSLSASANSRIVLNFTNNKQKILQAIDSLQFSHMNTLLGDGLKSAIELLQDRATKHKSILMITDGDNIADSQKALQEKKNADKMNIKIKPIAVGGASLTMLKQFSSTGRVYDLTSDDLADVTMVERNFKDNILSNFASLSAGVFSKNKKDEKNILIIYSTMMERSNLYDFYQIPNLSDGLFYKELIQKLKDENLQIDFHGMEVYVKLIGEPTAQKENQLRIFWERFINDHGGKSKFFSKDSLTIDELGY
jgi:uncharacterized protein YegL